MMRLIDRDHSLPNPEIPLTQSSATEIGNSPKLRRRDHVPLALLERENKDKRVSCIRVETSGKLEIVKSYPLMSYRPVIAALPAIFS